MKRLIVNADDFGLGSGVNDAVIQAHRAGVLTSASLMATFPGFEQAVELARAHPALEIGAHIVLAKGVPASRPADIPSLVGADGRFLSRPRLLARALSGRLQRRDVEREVRAQLQRIVGTGLPLSHINGDQHVHVFPVVRDVVVDVARELRLASRVPNDRLVVDRTGGPTGGALRRDLLPRLRRRAGGVLCAAYRRLCGRAGVPVNEVFLSPFGVLPQRGISAATFARLLALEWRGTAELMVHPAFVDASLVAFWRKPERASERERELHAMLDRRFSCAVDANAVRLVGFRSLLA